MAEPPAFPILDDHLHLSPQGHGVEAARRFQKAGGSHAMLVRLPAYSRSVAEFEQSVADHVAFARRVAAETGLVLYPVVGPYPLELMRVAHLAGAREDGGGDAGALAAAERFMEGCLEAAGRAVARGDAVAIGEVGRPHFSVPDEVWQASNRLMVLAMRVAKQVDCAVMLHTEHAEPAQFEEFGRMADQAGLSRHRVVKHYSGPWVRGAENHGLVPSIICGRSNLRAALEKGREEAEVRGRFMLETDYIDSRERPDVVMPPDTVPKRTLGLLQAGTFDEETCYRVHQETPQRTYGVAFERAA